MKYSQKIKRVAASILIMGLMLSGCGKERYLRNLYNASSELFSSSYDMSELYNYYEPEYFVLDGQKMTYTDTEKYESRVGIDVSEHNEEVDWKAVKAAGYDFVFIRIGYRGYADEGSLQVDPRFEENYKGAVKAGLDVGVYFFSQAINDEEAAEEAQFVLETLDGRDLDLPVVYDVESIDGASARTDKVTGTQFTSNVKTFSEEIVNGGYNPCVYANLMWETFTLDMRELYALPVWFSGYENTPSSAYNFAFWQYSETGTVDGINGNVDLNIQMIPVEEENE